MRSKPTKKRCHSWPQCRHTELEGRLFPFSRGCSFYLVDDDGRITWGRDCVESSPPKPGDGTIQALGVLTPLLRAIGLERADPANLSKLPLQSAAMWAFYAGAPQVYYTSPRLYYRLIRCLRS